MENKSNGDLRIKIPTAVIFSILLMLGNIFSGWLIQNREITAHEKDITELRKNNSNHHGRIESNEAGLKVQQETIKSICSRLEKIETTVDQIRNDQVKFFMDYYKARGRHPSQ